MDVTKFRLIGTRYTLVGGASTNNLVLIVEVALHTQNSELQQNLAVEAKNSFPASGLPRVKQSYWYIYGV